MTKRKTGRHTIINPTQMKNLKAKWKSHNKPDADNNYVCWICKQPVSNDTMTLDHVMPVHDWPEYAFELSNLRPAHAWCNSEREFDTLKMLRGRKILRKIRIK